MLTVKKIFIDDTLSDKSPSQNQVVNKSYVDTVVLNKADTSYVDNKHSVQDNVILNKADTAYVDTNFVKNKITENDIPSQILLGTNFSLRDMAEDLKFLENQFYENSSLKTFMESYRNNTINLKDVVNKSNLILTNICRNFVNDPERMCFDPSCFYKRVMILTSAGQPFVDVSTYKDDQKGINRNLNLDRDLIYLETVEKHNIVDNTTNIEIFNPSNVDISNLNNLGIVKRRRYFAYTDPSNLIEKNINLIDPNNPNDINSLDNTNTFIYSTLNTTNPIPSNKIPKKYERAQDMSSSQEVLDAVKNGWGYVTKVNASYGYLPGYFIAHNSSLPIPDEHSAIIRLSYQIY
jgi:hypothetical protein